MDSRDQVCQAEELWMEFCNIVWEVVIKITLNKNKCEKAKWLPEEALKIAEKIREVKGKVERVKYTQWNADFQTIAKER